MNWPKIRAWGWYATLIRTPWFCVKLLRFKPNGKLSMQRHQHRTEIWWFIRGASEFYTPWYNPAWSVEKIKPMQWHTYQAYENPVYILELQYGKKVTENDIERK